MGLYPPSNPSSGGGTPGAQGPKGDKGDPGARGPAGPAGADSTVVTAFPAGNPADLAALVVTLKATGLLT